MLTIERIEEIFEAKDNAEYVNKHEDSVLIGLNILSKYSKSAIQAAEHDIIYSMSIEDAIERGITEEEIIQLAEGNWMLDENGCFSHFV